MRLFEKSAKKFVKKTKKQKNKKQKKILGEFWTICGYIIA